jgi:hypothetical protein
MLQLSNNSLKKHYQQGFSAYVTCGLVSSKQHHGLLVSPGAHGKVELGAHHAIISRLCSRSRAWTRTELDGVVTAIHSINQNLQS